MRRLTVVFCLFLFVGVGRMEAQRLVLRTLTLQEGDSVRQTMRLLPPAFSLWKRNYLMLPVEQQPTESVMLQNRHSLSRGVDLSPFRCGPFWVPDPPPLFEDCYYYNSVGAAVFSGIVEGTIDALLNTPKRPSKKERAKALAKRSLSNY